MPARPSRPRGRPRCGHPGGSGEDARHSDEVQSRRDDHERVPDLVIAERQWPRVGPTQEKHRDAEAVDHTTRRHERQLKCSQLVEEYRIVITAIHPISGYKADASHFTRSKTNVLRRMPVTASETMIARIGIPQRDGITTMVIGT